MSLKGVKEALKSSYPTNDNEVFFGRDCIIIPKDNGVYKGIGASCTKRKATPTFLDSLRKGGEYTEIEENVFNSPKSAVVIVRDKAYEFLDGMEIFTHKNFLEYLET